MPTHHSIHLIHSTLTHILKVRTSVGPHTTQNTPQLLLCYDRGHFIFFEDVYASSATSLFTEQHRNSCNRQLVHAHSAQSHGFVVYYDFPVSAWITETKRASRKRNKHINCSVHSNRQIISTGMSQWVACVPVRECVCIACIRAYDNTKAKVEYLLEIIVFDLLLDRDGEWSLIISCVRTHTHCETTMKRWWTFRTWNIDRYRCRQFVLLLLFTI